MKVEKVNLHIVSWLKDYALKAKVNGFVVGVSGGIDSAVTSTLCAQTGLKTICLQLPIHQAQSHVDRKIEHITQLQNRFSNVSAINIDLSESFESLKNTYPKSENETAYLLSLANTRSRLRMTTLYFVAGIHGLLVAGTGNKVEDFGVGFYTKYGDGGVDLSPIADLMKSEVYALGEFLEVPKSILEAKPTDGLFGDDRSDEDQLGASYDELEWAMMFDGNLESCNKREKEVLGIYKKLHQANQHKMNPIPVCLIPIDLK
jgi:NAD+ synthase